MPINNSSSPAASTGRSSPEKPGVLVPREDAVPLGREAASSFLPSLVPWRPGNDSAKTPPPVSSGFSDPFQLGRSMLYDLGSVLRGPF
uniref:Uncharacterized protein n=1 Tax=Monodelphis domestica TaxID=13616 RepID=A0A5F8GMI4_MONDO